jgi:hypothetical protein
MLSACRIEVCPASPGVQSPASASATPLTLSAAICPTATRCKPPWLSAAVRQLAKRLWHQDPVRVLVDLADGRECISDLATLRQQPELFGEVASTPTAWRCRTGSTGPCWPS